MPSKFIPLPKGRETIGPDLEDQNILSPEIPCQSQHLLTPTHPECLSSQSPMERLIRAGLTIVPGFLPRRSAPSLAAFEDVEFSALFLETRVLVDSSRGSKLASRNVILSFVLKKDQGSPNIVYRKEEGINVSGVLRTISGSEGFCSEY